MGLEVAEFLLNVEKTFNVNILDSDLSGIDTLEQLITLLEEEIAKSPLTQAEADSLFQGKFRVIQRFFAEELAIDLDSDVVQLTPETKVAPLLYPLPRRRRIWTKMRKEMSPNIPPLHGKFYRECAGGFSVFIGFFIGLGASIEWGGALILWRVLYGIIIGILGGTVLFAILMGFWHICFSRWFSTIPKECDSLQGLTRYIVRKISLDPEGNVWTQETITETVLRIISEQMGISRENISLTDDLIKIFG